MVSNKKNKWSHSYIPNKGLKLPIFISNKNLIVDVHSKRHLYSKVK